MKKILVKKALLAMMSIVVIVYVGCTHLYKQDIYHKDLGVREDNSFFFQSIGSWIYNAKFTGFSELSNEEIELRVMKVCNVENDVVYELIIKVEQEVQDRYGTDRLNLGYFFVTEDKIYKICEEILPYESLTKETLVSIGTLVCQEEEKKDTLAPDEPGWHERIEVDGNIRKYYGYNTLMQTGYYEQFIWEKGKGLIKYKSGYGAEAYDIELYLVK